MLSIDRHPAQSQLRTFGILLAIFTPIAGALIWWRSGRLEYGAIAWAAAGLLTAAYWLAPASRRAIYVGWMYAAFPIGWTVSHVLMACIFYAVITPIGAVMRAAGYDPLSLGLDRSARTYWSPHPPRRDVGSYFKQY